MNSIAFDGTIDTQNEECSLFTYLQYREWVATRGTPEHLQDRACPASYSASLLRGVNGLIAEIREIQTAETSQDIVSEACDIYFWLTYLDDLLGLYDRLSLEVLDMPVKDYFAALSDAVEKATRQCRGKRPDREEKLRRLLSVFACVFLDCEDNPHFRLELAQTNYDKLTKRRPDVNVAA